MEQGSCGAWKRDRLTSLRIGFAPDVIRDVDAAQHSCWTWVSARLGSIGLERGDWPPKFKIRIPERIGSRRRSAAAVNAGKMRSPTVRGGVIRRGGRGPFHILLHGAAIRRGWVAATITAGAAFSAGPGWGAAKQCDSSTPASRTSCYARSSASPRSSQSESDSDSQNRPEPSQRFEEEIAKSS